MRPGDAAWSRAERAYLEPPEMEECPECGGLVVEVEDGVECAEDDCEWSVYRPEPDDYEDDPRDDRDEF